MLPGAVYHRDEATQKNKGSGHCYNMSFKDNSVRPKESNTVERARHKQHSQIKKYPNRSKGHPYKTLRDVEQTKKVSSAGAGKLINKMTN